MENCINALYFSTNQNERYAVNLIVHILGNL